MTVDLPPPVPDAPTDIRTPRSSSATVPHGVRPGDLTLVWRFVVMFGWMFAFFAYAAVWQASVQLGIATWWTGPRSRPAPTLIRMIPFFLTIIGGMMAVYNVRRISHVSLGFAALTVLIALPDFTRSVGLAVVELLISGSLIVVSLSSLTGRYRLALVEPDAPGSDDRTPGDHMSNHLSERDDELADAWASPVPPSATPRDTI